LTILAPEDLALLGGNEVVNYLKFGKCDICETSSFGDNLNYIALTKGHYCNRCFWLGVALCTSSFAGLVFVIGYMWGK
jgi:hypothetical protein